MSAEFITMMPVVPGRRQSSKGLLIRASHWIVVALAVLFASATLVGSSAFAAPVSMPRLVASVIKQVGLPKSSIGIFVQQADSRRPLLAYNADHSMNPASTMKLLTTFAGLEMLGPAYTWKTEIYTSGSMQGDVLNGDLIIKGYGDPSLTLENFWMLLRKVREMGVREIHGDLVLDRQYFRSERGDPAAFDNRPYRPYNAAPDSLLVNFNTLRFRVYPDPVAATIRIVADAPTMVNVVNNLARTEAPCDEWRDAVNTEVQASPQGTTVVFNGTYPANCGEKMVNLALFNNAQFVFGMFRQLWGEQGGVFTGGLRDGKVDENARYLTRIESRPLMDVVRDINKFSNNVMARQLFLTIGAERSGKPGSEEVAAQAVRDWLHTKGLDFPELVLENGSGLSRIERISPRHLAGLLLAAFDSPVFSELESSLPIVSVDGTMRKRLNDETVAGHAHIKSGTLDGVKVIAGYVFDKKGRRVVVVCMINNTNASLGQGVQDALLEWVYNRP